MTLLYDGDCEFCLRWIVWLKPRFQENLAVRPFQGSLADFPNVSEEECKRAVQLIRNDGSHVAGAGAIFEALSKAHSGSLIHGMYLRIAPFRWLSNSAYRWVARHRSLSLKILNLLWGPSMPFSTRYEKTFTLITRGLGFTFLIAFVSLSVQMEGLWGTNGILPIQELLDFVARNTGLERYGGLPTLFWASSGQSARLSILALGFFSSLLLVMHRHVRIASFVSWISYLSFVNVGQIFTAYQWDMLLLESGFALMLATWIGPGRISIFLFRLLFFKLVYQSGMAKLNSGDESWTNLTALTFHFETTPLPTPLSWFVHQLPTFLMYSMTLATLVIECFTPFFFFLSRNIRFTLFIVHLVFQLFVAATGNYGFFNTLTIMISISLLEDSLPPFRRLDFSKIPSRTPYWTLFCFVWSGLCLSKSPPIPELLERWHLFSSYGLFASMTKERQELTIEGTRDNVWIPYVFKWKPNQPNERPRWSQPHMPRLDWQMWFAAMQKCEGQWWLRKLLEALLEGRKEVLDLFVTSAEQNPIKIRVTSRTFRFTGFNDTENWWNAGPPTIYCEEVSKENVAAN